MSPLSRPPNGAKVQGIKPVRTTVRADLVFVGAFHSARESESGRHLDDAETPSLASFHCETRAARFETEDYRNKRPSG